MVILGGGSLQQSAPPAKVHKRVIDARNGAILQMVEAASLGTLPVRLRCFASSGGRIASMSTSI